IGQAGGRPDISLARVATNLADARIPDNDGNQPVDVPAVEEGAIAYYSTLPMQTIVKKPRQEAIPSSVSPTAGTFVFNHSFYGLMHELEKHDKKIKVGFIHITFLPE
ncbi:pyroglutamyl-peptidase I family protein, partial [Bacillus cereus]|uniref:pyroglutamyl-peptidase I family protein n=1 Tax=Bacillus cereus TaxID=1396 RepID=UPI00284AFA2D|nr:pyroglutamyl-peptidase I [Bacillus cereus]